MYKVVYYNKETGELLCWHSKDRYEEAMKLLARNHKDVRAELEVTHV